MIMAATDVGLQGCGHYSETFSICRYEGCATTACPNCSQICEFCRITLCPDHQQWRDGLRRVFCPDHSMQYLKAKLVRKLLHGGI